MELLRFLFLRATQDIFVVFFRFRGVAKHYFLLMKYKPIFWQNVMCVAMTFGAVNVSMAQEAQIGGG